MRPKRYRLTAPELIDHFHMPWLQEFGSLTAAFAKIRSLRKWHGRDRIQYTITKISSGKTWKT